MIRQGGVARLTQGGWPDGVTPGFVEVGANPSVGSGFAAPLGSIAKFGAVYYAKNGALATDWNAIPYSSGSGDWADMTATRIAAMCGLVAGGYGVFIDRFDRYGSTGAVTDFGDCWTRAVVNGECTHDDVNVGTDGAAGGMCWLSNGSSDFLASGLTFKGPNLWRDHAAARWALAFRMRVKTAPAADANLDWRLGLQKIGGGAYQFLGLRGGTSQTHFTLMCSPGGVGGVEQATTLSLAAALNTTREVVLLQKPVGATRVFQCWLDGVLLKEIVMGAALIDKRVMNFECNKGAVGLQHVVSVYPNFETF